MIKIKGPVSSIVDGSIKDHVCQNTFLTCFNIAQNVFQNVAPRQLPCPWWGIHTPHLLRNGIHNYESRNKKPLSPWYDSLEVRRQLESRRDTWVKPGLLEERAGSNVATWGRRKRHCSIVWWQQYVASLNRLTGTCCICLPTDSVLPTVSMFPEPYRV